MGFHRNNKNWVTKGHSFWSITIKLISAKIVHRNKQNLKKQTNKEEL